MGDSESKATVPIPATHSISPEESDDTHKCTLMCTRPCAAVLCAPHSQQVLRSSCVRMQWYTCQEADSAQPACEGWGQAQGISLSDSANLKLIDGWRLCYLADCRYSGRHNEAWLAQGDRMFSHRCRLLGWCVYNDFVPSKIRPQSHPGRVWVLSATLSGRFKTTRTFFFLHIHLQLGAV